MGLRKLLCSVSHYIPNSLRDMCGQSKEKEKMCQLYCKPQVLKLRSCYY